jgi:hypothetical protein
VIGLRGCLDRTDRRIRAPLTGDERRGWRSWGFGWGEGEEVVYLQAGGIKDRWLRAGFGLIRRCLVSSRWDDYGGAGEDEPRDFMRR